MTDLLKAAWTGWRDYCTVGKEAGIFLAALIFLLYQRKKCQSRELLAYTTGMTILCIFPVTAVLLMLYQTKFYDYQWIFSLVPVTAVTALAATVLLTDTLPAFTKGKKECAAVVFALLAMLFIGSGLGQIGQAKSDSRTEREETMTVLNTVHAALPEETIRLWAPAEVLEYVRECDGTVELLYGRNMWDEHLNAFSYEVYPEELKKLYDWMENSNEKTVTAEVCMETAQSYQINCILLPKDTEEEILKEFSKEYSLDSDSLAQYYLLTK